MLTKLCRLLYTRCAVAFRVVTGGDVLGWKRGKGVTLFVQE